MHAPVGAFRESGTCVHLNSASERMLGTKVMQNYESACTADIYSPTYLR